MSEIVFFVAQLHLLTMLMSSLLSSNVKPVVRLSSKARRYLPMMENLLNYFHGPILLVVIYLIGLAANSWACFIGSVMYTVTIVCGGVLRSRDVVVECRCFGHFGRGKRSDIALYGTSMMSSCSLVFLSAQEIAYKTSGAPSSGSIVILAWVFAVSTGYFVKLHGQEIGEEEKGTASSVLDATTSRLSSLSQGQVIGERADGKLISLSELDDSRPLIIVGMSVGCEACAVLKLALGPLAAAFHEHIRTLVTYDGSVDEQLAMGQQVPVVLGNGSGFGEKLEAVAYPFALLIDPQSGRVLSPLTYGPHQIWLLYFVALGLLRNNK
jgi:hypothetical protein